MSDPEIFGRAGEFLAKGQSVVLCTLVEKKGSGPREPGAKMLVTPDGKALAMASSSLSGDQGSSLYIVNADGTRLAVVPNTGDVFDPAWRP